MTNALLNSLLALPFSTWDPALAHDPVIEQFSSGYSHQVFKVSFYHLCTNQEKKLVPRFVAKYVGNKKTRYAEYKASKKAYRLGVGVKPVYFDNEWLVTEYFEGITLDNSQFSTSQKLQITIPLIKSFHQKEEQKGSLLDILKVIKELLQHSHLQPKQQQLMLTVALDYLPSKHEESLNDDNICLIHGDVNFSNVLFNQHTKSAVLIDFEAASYADKNYELGMMMAINLIPPHTLFFNSEYLCFKDVLHEGLVTRYAILSSIINALWYFSQINKDEGQYFEKLALEQVKFVDMLTDTKYLLIKQMR